MISLPYLYSASGGFSLLRVSAYISLLENCMRFPEAVMPVGQVRQKQTEIGIPQGIALTSCQLFISKLTTESDFIDNSEKDSKPRSTTDI